LEHPSAIHGRLLLYQEVMDCE